MEKSIMDFGFFDLIVFMIILIGIIILIILTAIREFVRVKKAKSYDAVQILKGQFRRALVMIVVAFVLWVVCLGILFIGWMLDTSGVF